MQPQVGEVLVLLGALVQPPEDGGDGGVAEPERRGGKHVGGRGVRGGIIPPVGPYVIIKGLLADDSRNIISHGYDLGVIKEKRGSQRSKKNILNIGLKENLKSEDNVQLKNSLKRRSYNMNHLEIINNILWFFKGYSHRISSEMSICVISWTNYCMFVPLQLTGENSICPYHYL